MNQSKPKKGYVYVLVDTAYPEYIKIGFAENLDNRIQHFNRNKPYKTAKYIYKSDKQNDARAAYLNIILLLLNHPECQVQKGLTRGWYTASNREAIKQTIAEYFDL